MSEHFNLLASRVQRRSRLGLMLGSAAASVLCLFAADAAVAQSAASDVKPATADTSTVAEVQVTATRRGSTSVQNTALAITAFSGQTLAQNRVTTLQQLSKIDPSLNVQSYGAAQTRVIIRGIESSIGSTTGIYLNETPLLGGTGSNILGDGKPGIRLKDLDHVEVLKGPQGTLFGSSSMSGTLRVITAKPNLETFSGSAEASAATLKGGDDFYDGTLVLNAPVIKDKVGLRGVLYGESGGGFIDQTVDGDTHKNNNDSHVKGGRITGLWRVTDDFSLTSSVTHQEVDVDGTQAWQKSQGAYANASPTIEFYKDNYNLYDGTAQYNLGFGSLVGDVSYANQRVISPKDSTPTGNSFGLKGSTLFVPTIKSQNFTSELRFSSAFRGPFQVVAGGFYENDDTDYQTNSILADADGTAECLTYSDCTDKGLRNPGRGNSKYEFGTLTHRKVEQYALYAQGDYKILKTLTATVGVRYFSAKIHDVVTNLQTVYPDYIFGNVTTPSVTGDTRGDNSKTSYNFSLLWQATPDISVYGRAASGFRIGGLNTATSLAQQAGVTFPGTYKPDSLWDYEAGVKSYWFNRILFVDLSVYHIDWKGQQLAAESAGAFSYTINAGKTTTDGVELNARIHPNQFLTFMGSVNYVDAKLADDLPTDVQTAGTYGFDGDRVPLIAKWSFALRGSYEHPITGDLDGYLSGGMNYRSASYTSFNDQNTFNTKLPSYALFDASAGVRSGGWDFGLFVDNITNKAAYLGVVTSQDGIRVFSPRPRTVGVRMAASF